LILQEFPIVIEAVARAIASSENVQDWRSRIPAARAALTALLEPSPEMLEAALPTETDWGYLPEEWRAMVQHVLDERAEGPGPS
jgi:hypothetical protein